LQITIFRIIFFLITLLRTNLGGTLIDILNINYETQKSLVGLKCSGAVTAPFSASEASALFGLSVVTEKFRMLCKINSKQDQGFTYWGSTSAAAFWGQLRLKYKHNLKQKLFQYLAK
jgi:hypothetical protein